MERRSLSAMLKSKDEAMELDWIKRMNIISDIAQALSYLPHNCNPPIVHQDIISNNIVLDEEYKACISDFGIAKLRSPNSSHWSSGGGKNSGFKRFNNLLHTLYVKFLYALLFHRNRSMAKRLFSSFIFPLRLIVSSPTLCYAGWGRRSSIFTVKPCSQEDP